jgi:hypothetical protein
MNNCRKQAGYALAGTIMCILIVTIMWLGVAKHIGTYLRMEKGFQLQQEYYDSCIRSLSWGLTLLETGLPPTNPYSCTVQVGKDGSQLFVITFEETVSLNYRVTTRPANDGDFSLPPAPVNFGSSTPP